MGVAIVLGTRPEIIKLAPVVRALRDQRVPFDIVHTGQHYSDSLDGAFFRDLRLPNPLTNLRVGSGPAAIQTGDMVMRLGRTLPDLRPSCVVVLGDTNSVLAGALASLKARIPVAHIEAGLRSRFRWMPEELNRILADQMSDVVFAPTDGARRNLIAEGVAHERIHVTGNTIVDAVHEHVALARQGPAPAHPRRGYFVATVHRAENVESPERFRAILEGLRGAAKATGLPVVYPIHPHARDACRRFRFSLEGVEAVPPMGYLDFLRLVEGAAGILTDSGGLQEEACILRIPCATLRDNTERPETLEVGANVLVGADAQRIVDEASRLLESKRTWDNPFGDGRASQRIANILMAKGWAAPEPHAPPLVAEAPR